MCCGWNFGWNNIFGKNKCETMHNTIKYIVHNTKHTQKHISTLSVYATKL